MAAPRDGGSDAAVGVAADTPGYWGFDTKNLDRSCKPCDDFFEFAMGGWMKANPIPPQYPRWGSFTVLLDKNQQNLRTILEAEEKTNVGGRLERAEDRRFLRELHGHDGHRRCGRESDRAGTGERSRR